MRLLTTSAMLVLSVLLLSGCATLNKDECLNADWRTIGLEDGARGELSSRIGRHREACAKHGVKPDLTAYQQGHAQGVKQFCTASVGFSRGRSGWTYNGVCPANLESDFLKAYEVGFEIYSLNREIQRNKSTITVNDRDIEETQVILNQFESELIADGTTPQRRLELLREIENLQKKIAELEAENKQLELENARLEGEVNSLETRSRY